MRQAEIRIYGVVQGVGFRFAALEKARALAIKGYVRNEPDHSVYIKAGGEDKNLAEFVEWCRHGPSLAKVENVDAQIYKEREILNDFVIHD